MNYTIIPQNKKNKSRNIKVIPSIKEINNNNTNNTYNIFVNDYKHSPIELYFFLINHNLLYDFYLIHNTNDIDINININNKNDININNTKLYIKYKSNNNISEYFYLADITQKNLLKYIPNFVIQTSTITDIDNYNIKEWCNSSQYISFISNFSIVYTYYSNNDLYHKLYDFENENYNLKDNSGISQYPLYYFCYNNVLYLIPFNNYKQYLQLITNEITKIYIPFHQFIIKYPNRKNSQYLIHFNDYQNLFYTFDNFKSITHNDNLNIYIKYIQNSLRIHYIDFEFIQQQQQEQQQQEQQHQEQQQQQQEQEINKKIDNQSNKSNNIIKYIKPVKKINSNIKQTSSDINQSNNNIDETDNINKNVIVKTENKSKKINSKSKKNILCVCEYDKNIQNDLYINYFNNFYKIFVDDILFDFNFSLISSIHNNDILYTEPNKIFNKNEIYQKYKDKYEWIFFIKINEYLLIKKINNIDILSSSLNTEQSQLSDNIFSTTNSNTKLITYKSYFKKCIDFPIIHCPITDIKLDKCDEKTILNKLLHNDIYNDINIYNGINKDIDVYVYNTNIVNNIDKYKYNTSSKINLKKAKTITYKINIV